MHRGALRLIASLPWLVVREGHVAESVLRVRAFKSHRDFEIASSLIADADA